MYAHFLILYQGIEKFRVPPIIISVLQSITVFMVTKGDKILLILLQFKYAQEELSCLSTLIGQKRSESYEAAAMLLSYKNFPMDLISSPDRAQFN